MNAPPNTPLAPLVSLIQQWGEAEGFNQVGISDVDVSAYREHYQNWLDAHYHGEMNYMQRHSELRLHPQQLHSGSLRAISFRMDYKHDFDNMQAVLDNPSKAYISRYALGQDYHKLIRKKLATIAKKIEEHCEINLNQRPFVDSAPVLERALAEKSGLGWIGKNTMLINSKAGSWFFLAEILTDLELPISSVEPSVHCGSCTSCLVACPTDAFVSANQLDARKCISYLTIELKNAIPIELRSKMGNRVFGCDDCQMVCPWNKFSQTSHVDNFKPRHGLGDSELLDLFLWSEDDFLENTAGSPIRRIGYQQWLRNLAIGLGNAPKTEAITTALNIRLNESNTGELVKEHILWALEQ